MNELTLFVVPRPRSRLLLSLLLGLLALGASAGAARADACSSCPAPSPADLAAQPDYPVGPWPQGTYLETLACECTYKVSGVPTVTQGPAWLVFRGSGEVWNCPESASDDHVTIEIAEGDSTSWSFAAEASATVKAVALEVALKVSAGVGGGHVITEVKRVTKIIRAQVGHRIPWAGYFELADFTLDMDLAVTRRWSWWIKNVYLGHTVLTSGSIFMDCGTDHATLTRRGSIGYKFRLADAPCSAGPATTPSDLGWWPIPLPPPPPPVTPGSDPLPPSVDDPDEPATPAAPPQGAPPAPAPAAPPPGPVPPPSPTNPHPEDSGGMGDAPTGPNPYPAPFTGPIASELLCSIVSFGDVP
jgi:hypothetical protein